LLFQFVSKRGIILPSRLRKLFGTMITKTGKRRKTKVKTGEEEWCYTYKNLREVLMAV